METLNWTLINDTDSWTIAISHENENLWWENI